MIVYLDASALVKRYVAEAGSRELARCASVALFVARARSVRPDFELTLADTHAVATICARVDGLPLGLELAAAQMKWRSPRELALRLAGGLETLTAEARHLPARQRTLGGAVEWSYRLLDEPERVVLCRLSVFRGGFGPDAGIEVAADEGTPSEVVERLLDALAEKSLLHVAREEGPAPRRFSMLETVREFAATELARREEEAATYRRHAEHFVALAGAIAPRLTVSPSRPWFELLEREHANLGSALAWLLASQGEPEDPARRAWRADTALRLCVRLWRFWRYRCHLLEGRRWTAAALALEQEAGGPSAPELLAEAYWGLAMFSAMTGQADEAQAQLEASLDIAQGQANDRGVANALTGLGWLASNRGDTDRGVALQTRAIELFARSGDEFKLTYAYNSIGETLRCANDDAGARRPFEASPSVCRRIGHARGAAVALANLGGIELAAGRRAAAGEAFRAALGEFVEISDPVNIATCLVGIGGTLDQPALIARALGCADHLLRETGGRLQPADQRQSDDLTARCRAALGEEGFARGRAEGCALSLSEAVEPAGL